MFTFFIPNVYGACLFFTNLDLFCIDNERVIYRKIRYFILEKNYFDVPCRGWQILEGNFPPVRWTVCRVSWGRVFDWRCPYLAVHSCVTQESGGLLISTTTLFVSLQHIIRASHHKITALRRAAETWYHTVADTSRPQYRSWPFLPPHSKSHVVDVAAIPQNFR